MIQHLQALKALARALTRFIRKRQGAECWRITWAPSSFPCSANKPPNGVALIKGRGTPGALPKTGFSSIWDDNREDRNKGSEKPCQAFTHNVLKIQVIWEVLTQANARSTEHPLETPFVKAITMFRPCSKPQDDRRSLRTATAGASRRRD
jgi:hypothetical protein